MAPFLGTAALSCCWPSSRLGTGARGLSCVSGSAARLLTPPPRHELLQPEAPPDLGVVDQAAALQVLDALAEGGRRLGVAQYIERLDDALK